MLRQMMLVTLIAAVITIAGCQSTKLTQDNFKMIQTGVDDRYDVRQILGEPDSDMGDVWIYDDPDRCTAQIFFSEDGRVLNKEWMSAKDGEWSGQNPWTDKPAEGEVRESHTKTRRIDKD